MNLSLQRFITVIGLGLGLVAYGSVASAQETGGPVINADGDSAASRSGVNPVADAGGPTIVYGDIDPGPGTTVIDLPAEEAAPATAPAPGTTENVTATDGNASVVGPGSASAAPGTVTSGSSGTSLLGPDGTYSVSDTPPSSVTVGESGAPAPAAEPVAAEPVAETTTTEYVEPAPADAAVATDADSDADNYPDAAELNLGLDPYNADGDADGVADGDELNIYGTDPFAYDTDGDGIADGEELFGILTDPLVWDTDGDGVGDGQTAVA